MKIHFVDGKATPIADSDSVFFTRTKAALLSKFGVIEEADPARADILLIKEKWSYKDFRYRDRLLADPLISAHLNKIFTINDDDSGSGYLRGLYTNTSAAVCDPARHIPVPYMEYFNEHVFSDSGVTDQEPGFLAGWRGNTISGPVRRAMVKMYSNDRRFCLETSQSWLNHGEDEKVRYVQMILNSRFSLCPPGWGPSSFRIYESMALGRCPVIIADRFVPPAGPDWNEFAIFFPERRLPKLHEYLEERKNEWVTLGEKARENWNRYFRRDLLPGYYAESLLQLIQNSPAVTKESEIAIWNSRWFYRLNGWTRLQRGRNKIRKLVCKLGFT